jgi:hypothetical protein
MIPCTPPRKPEAYFFFFLAGFFFAGFFAAFLAFAIVLSPPFGPIQEGCRCLYGTFIQPRTAIGFWPLSHKYAHSN